MASDGEIEQNALLRGIIASVVAGTGTELPQGAAGTEQSVAQLIAAAMTQLGQNIVSLQEGSDITDEPHESQNTINALAAGTDKYNDDNSFNPETARFMEEDSSVGGASSQEEEKPGKPKPICVKLPIETRKRIIAMRKEGKKCKDIAKELKVSVSGAQKVWERFLATGKVHDRKPSEYAGRPRKSIAFSQGSDSTSPLLAKTHHIHVGETVDISQNDNEHTIEYAAASGAIGNPPTTGEDTVVISEDGDVYVGGPLDVPGATVEIVESEPIPVATPTQRQTPTKKKTEYRQHLLLKLIEGCPLALLREDKAMENQKNPHVTNLSSSINRPLYMESVLGHPFGKVPPSKPFDGNLKEAEVILSDPANPVGKDLVAALGYSTKVYFNACCKPSQLFDASKVISSLPFSFEPGYLADTTQKVLQLFIDLCKDPLAALQRLPEGDGPVITAKSSNGEVLTKKCPAPKKLSDYWVSLYKYAELFECCENFLSASTPSAPCLLCHPFEKLAQTLEIRDQEEADFSPSVSLRSLSSSTTVAPVPHSHTVDSLTHHIEVQVLESGQVAMSSGAGFLTTESTAPPAVLARGTLTSLQDAGSPVEPMTVSSTPQMKRAHTATGLQRRVPSTPSDGSISSGKVSQEDQVEVDGQFDMPIPDSISSETASTGTSAVMTVVMTSEGLSQMVSPEGKGQQPSPLPSNMKSVGQQTQHTLTLGQKSSPSETLASKAPPTAPPTPPVAIATGRKNQVKQKGSINAATQTTNGNLRPEVQDRTPLIIRRSRAGKGQKLAVSSSTKQQQPVPVPTDGVDAAVKLVEPNIRNGNETGTPACQEVQIQTQSPSGMKLSSVGIQATESVANEPGSNKDTVPSQTPRRSTRKSAHKISPEKNEAAVTTISPSSAKRISPARKSPAKTSPIASEGVQNLSRIRTRAAAKRCGLDQQSATERTDTPPPAKRSRRTVVEKPVDDTKDKHPQHWGVNEVAEFIESFQSDCTNTFREHEVDGESLFTLDPEMMVKLMNLKTGPALKIHRKVAALKKQYGTLPSST